MISLNDFYKNKRVFVTGHTGFKGSWLCHWLELLGAEVGGFSLAPDTNPSLCTVLRIPERVNHQIGDVIDLQLLTHTLQSFRPDLIFHLAAQPLVRRSYENPLETFSTNVMGTAHVLEAAKFIPNLKSVIAITTDKVYENREIDYGYRESDALGGNDPYSASKACAEHVIHAYSHSFFKTRGPIIVSARAGNVIGGGDWSSDRIIPDAIRAWTHHQMLNLRNPNSTRPWQHVIDSVGAYLNLGMQTSYREELRGESFNFGPTDPESIPVVKLITDLSRHFEVAPFTTTSPVAESSHKHEAGLLKLNCEKADRVLGWKPVIPYSQAIEWTSLWYKQFQSRPKTISNLVTDQIQTYMDQAKAMGVLK